jgi:DNA repair protein RadA/Sms
MKDRKVYTCRNCGAQSPKWQGKCNACGEWDTFEEGVITQSSKKHQNSSISESKVVRLSDISTEGEYRISTHVTELDRVLGGGIIPGSLVLVGGDPGIGKSTLMLQMCSGIALHKPLYVSGEESLRQIKFRSTRLKGVPEDLALLAETSIEHINHAIKSTECGVVIVDSIQSVYSEQIEATPGSMVQVRECASLLMQTAKQTNTPIFIIGHVTKDGIIAGPKILEHLVDTVLQFEGEKTYSYRILRALKNRFGSTNEIGIFEMAEEGLREVTNPSEIFLVQRQQEASGVAIVAALEGTRPILLEVQALVSPTGYAVPQRTATGFDSKRLSMILAVLEKRLGEKLRQMDVFVNIAGGVYLNDPALDLGIAAAVVSSLRDRPIEPKTVLIGEIGLTGEVRSVSSLEQRVREAQKLGFEKVVIPKAGESKLSDSIDIKIVSADRISLALSNIFI